MTKYKERGFCSACQKYYEKDQLLKLFIKGVNATVYYCPIHRRQVRLKARSVPMSLVKILVSKKGT